MTAPSKAGKERKKVASRKERVALALTVSESLSSQEKAETVLGYRSGEIAAITAAPEVVRAVKAGLVRRLVAEAAPRSLGLLLKIVEQGHAVADKGEAPTNTQADAAKSLMQFAGLQAAAEELRIHKDPGEMNGAELEEAMKRLADAQRQLGAVEVDGTVSAPSDAPVQGQAIDNVDDLFS